MNSLKKDEEVLLAFLSGVNQVNTENWFSHSFLCYFFKSKVSFETEVSQ